MLSPEDFHNNPSKVVFFGYQSVPDTWNDYNIPEAKNGTGSATYRMTIKTDSNKGRIYGLKIFTEATSYKVFANNEIVLSAGEVGNTPETSAPQYNAQVVYFYSY